MTEQQIAELVARIDAACQEIYPERVVEAVYDWSTEDTLEMEFGGIN